MEFNFTDETITDHAIPLVQRALVAQIKRELKEAEASLSQKVGAAQALIYQASKLLGLQYTLVAPKKGGFDKTIKKIFATAEFLPLETLLELAAEILEEATGQNG
jgi:hypothetical protein